LNLCTEFSLPGVTKSIVWLVDQQYMPKKSER
jgi:hypothetical protein